MPNVGFSGSPPGVSVYIPTPTATTSFAVSNAKMHAPRAADSFCMLKVHAPFMAARCREFIPYIKRTGILPSPWRRGGSSPSIQRIARRPRPRAILSTYQNGGSFFRKAPPSFPILARNDSRDNSQSASYAFARRSAGTAWRSAWAKLTPITILMASSRMNGAMPARKAAMGLIPATAISCAQPHT